MYELYTSIGSCLRKWREKHNITAYTVAGDLGVSPQYFSDLENGRRTITLPTLIKWSKIIGCPPEYALQVYSSPKIRTKTKNSR